MAERWVDIAAAEDFPPGTQAAVEVGGRSLVLMNLDERYFAVANICPHAGRPLAEGEVANFKLTCPFHGYTYDLRTGKNVDFPHEELPVRTFAVRVENGRVQVLMEDRGG
ncbi:MAG: non-heme iron oxygenase ferredoxin subunit [Phycisphaeraceae bacterium]|nr:non-heme iron oxygenase ferredoxin subunit [Phycisphaeraceae bacterium]